MRATIAAGIVLALTAWLAACGQAPGPSPNAPPGAGEATLSVEAFGDDVQAALEAANPGARVKRVDGETLRIIQPGIGGEDGAERTVFTGYTYSQYRKDPATKAALIATLTQVDVTDTDMSNVDERLVVVLRPSDYGANSGLGEVQIVRRPMVEGIDAVLMLDSPDRLSVVMPDTLSEAGLSEDEGFDLAAANLRRLIGPLEIEPYEGLEIVGAASALATGALWLPEACVAGAPATYAYVVDRQTYLRASDEDMNGVGALMSFAAGMSAEDDWFTDRVMACNDGEWSWIRPRFDD